MLRKAERAHIEDMVKAAAFALQPDLVELRHEIRDDWSGDPSIFFTLVVGIRLSAGRNPSFDRVVHMEEAIRLIVEPQEYGLNPYFSCHSNLESAMETQKC